MRQSSKYLLRKPNSHSSPFPIAKMLATRNSSGVGRILAFAYHQVIHGWYYSKNNWIIC